MAPWIAVLAQALADKQKEAQARTRKANQIQSQYAASQGAPTYGIEAASFERNMRDQGGGSGIVDSVLQQYMNPKRRQG
jgi:hypothetical protein